MALVPKVAVRFVLVVVPMVTDGMVTVMVLLALVNTVQSVAVTVCAAVTVPQGMLRAVAVPAVNAPSANALVAG